MQGLESTPSLALLAATIDAVRRQPGVNDLAIAPDSQLADLGINSLRLVRLILTLQKQLNAPPLAIEQVGNVRTVADLSKLFDGAPPGSSAGASAP